ncbi:MAG: lactate utilization protein C [Kiloniellaceae bacterium]|nr:lactate utilization protein C [Kiloniellaceae bacterium]
MSSAKQLILSSLRRSLRREQPSAEVRALLEQRLAAPQANLVPQRAQLPHAEQLDLMERMLKELSASVVRLPSEAAVPQAVADYLKGENLPPKLRMAPRDDLRALPWQSQPLLEVEEGIAEAEDATSLTGAFAGIAETGTVMMASGPEAPVTLNFLPENHIVVLRASQIIGTYEEAWQRLRAAQGRGVMPRAVNMITGPSRTGDIEQTILLGAHGPRRLHVLLVDDRDAVRTGD